MLHGPYSVYELMRFFSVRERKRHAFDRMLGNFRLRMRGRKCYPILDWRR